MIKGQEFHNIIRNIFIDVNGYLESEQVQVNCPRCAEFIGSVDNKFNLEINTAKRVFRCWKCDEPRFSGTLGRLIKNFGADIDYKTYKAFAGTYYSYYDEEDEKQLIQVKLPDEMIYFSQMELNNPDHFEAYNYLINDRKLNRETILKYRLGFCVEGKYKKMIIVPSFDFSGEINYFVARNYDRSKKKTYDNPKSDKSNIIFNEGFINWDSTIYLVEGVFEMLSFPVNTIPMLGKRMSNFLVKNLKKIKPNIVIVLDPDAYKETMYIIHTLKIIYFDSKDKVKMVMLPKDKNNYDLDKIRECYGVDKVIEYLRGARDINVDDYFVYNLTSLYGKK